MKYLEKATAPPVTPGTPARYQENQETQESIGVGGRGPLRCISSLGALGWGRGGGGKFGVGLSSVCLSVPGWVAGGSRVGRGGAGPSLVAVARVLKNLAFGRGLWLAF